MDLVESKIPAPDLETLTAGLQYAVRMLNAYGITSIQDSKTYADFLPGYHALDERDELTLRVVGANYWDTSRGMEQLEEIRRRREHFTGKNFRPTSVKIWLDGVMENYTAAMLDPYLVEGKKTCGLEIAEQTAGDPTDWVIVSVGDGCTIAGIAKGLRQMHELGMLPAVPRVLGVQAAGVDPIARAFERSELPKVSGTTVADSIDVPVPRNWRKAVQAVRDTNGAFVRVTRKTSRYHRKLLTFPLATMSAGEYISPLAPALAGASESPLAYRTSSRSMSAPSSSTGAPWGPSPGLHFARRLVPDAPRIL